jgi:hypothetical protein
MLTRERIRVAAVAVAPSTMHDRDETKRELMRFGAGTSGNIASCRHGSQ